MDGFRAMKLKRKELEEVNEDFYDFSLSSPATKIRRLDADFAPVMGEEEMAPPFVSPTNHHSFDMGPVRNSGIIIEELPSEPENEERALVLFKPMNTVLNQSPSSHSILMDPELLSRIKNKIWPSQPNIIESTLDESNTNSDTGNQSLAVVPWAPSKIPSSPDVDVSLMESDDMGVTSMDIEEENVNIDQGLTNLNSNVSNPVEHLNQRQQHCLVPQLPQNTSAPITWYR